MDMLHYSPQVNQYMLDCVVADAKRVTTENVDAVLANMRSVYQYIIEEGIFLYYPKASS